MTRFRVVEYVTIERVYEVLAYTKHEAATIVQKRDPMEDDGDAMFGRSLVSQKVIGRRFETIDEISDRIR